MNVEVARTEAQREHGLMGRKDLGPRDGMIFVFDRDDHLSFWMKDTPTPLSIAFLSKEGKVLEIDDMQPFSESIIRSRFSARYALEMRQGAFADGREGRGRGPAPRRFPLRAIQFRSPTARGTAQARVLRRVTRARW